MSSVMPPSLSGSNGPRQDHVMRDLVRRVRDLVADLQRWVEQTILWRIWGRMLENEFLDRSVALAGKAFVSLFPAIIVVAAFAPSGVRDSMYSTIANRMGLSGQGLTAAKDAFATSDDVRRATGYLGLILTFFYINSFTTALGRVYLRAFRRPPGRKITGYALGASWLVGLAAYFATLGYARHFLNGGFRAPFFVVVAVVSAVALWWLTVWVMLDRQVRWRPLLPTALFTSGALVLFIISAQVWMPHTMKSNQHQFGTFGVTLAMVTWLTGFGIIVVVSACAGAELADDRGVLGRLVRGGDDDILLPGSRPSLPPPAHQLTLSDAIGRGRESVDSET
jgi:membrane protein